MPLPIVAAGAAVGTVKLAVLIKGAVVAKGAAATKGAVVAKGAALKAGEIAHLPLPLLLGGTAAVSTYGGVIFMDTYKKVLDDLQKDGQRRGRRKVTRSEASEVLQTVYQNTMAALKAKGIFTPTDQQEMANLRSDCQFRLWSSGMSTA
jgi:hypothetical protein